MALKSGGDDAQAIAVDKVGNLYLSGDYWNTEMAFGSDTLHSAGLNVEPFFIAKYGYNPNTNSRPRFTGGASQSLAICENAAAVSVNSLLRVIDIDTGQSETWQVLVPPAHGMLFAAYSTTSTGDTLTPSGLTYAPASGFSGTDSFKIVVTDCGNASDTTTIHVVITPLPFIETSPYGEIVCIGSIALIPDSPSYGSWSATNGNANVGIHQVMGIATGIDTILHIITNSCGTATATTIVTVEPVPSVGPITGPNALCAGDSMVLTDTTAGGRWDGAIALAAPPGAALVRGGASGNFNVYYDISNFCGEAYATHLVSIAPLPIVMPIVRNGDQLSVSSGYHSYQWLLNGSPIPGATTGAYLVEDVGTYTVRITNSYGCSVIDSVVIISDCSPSDLQVYPNPAQYTVYIQWCKNVTAKLYCMDGKLVETINNAKGINLSYLPDANYVLVVFDAQGKRIATKQVTKLSQ